MAVLIPDDDAALDALTALRDAGLCTDSHHLNTAWADLIGRPRPSRDEGNTGTPNNPNAWPTTGPCTGCGTLHQRYGEHGQARCPACREDGS